MMHSRDEHCTLGADMTCTLCGVSHASPCHACGGAGFHRDGCTLDATEAAHRFAPLRAALVAMGWATEDLTVEHTGGNVFAMQVVILRAGDRSPQRWALVGDPIGSDTWGGCIEDVIPALAVEDLGRGGPSTDDATDPHAVAAWLTPLIAPGFRPSMPPSVRS